MKFYQKINYNYIYLKNSNFVKEYSKKKYKSWMINAS